MTWFNNKKNNEPIPKGMFLIKTADSDELYIDRLTQEILRQDLEFIRSFYEKLCTVLNEKLTLLDGVSQSQQQLGVLISKLGIAQENLLAANLGVLSEIRRSIDSQNANHAQTVNTLLGVIESLNKLVELQNQTIAGTGRISVEVPADTRIKPAELAERPRIAAKGQKDYGESSDKAELPDRVETDQQIAVAAGQHKLPADETEEEKKALGIIDPEQFSRRLLADIRQNVENIFGKDTSFDERSAGEIPGFQSGKIWLLALPPRIDGKYDSSVLQDSAFKKIKACLSKHKEETVIAVYKGEISEKKLSGAKKVADDLKIVLTNFSDISKELGKAHTPEVENADG